MAEALNPYRQWLGLDTDAERLNHYELLDLPLFEMDEETIHHAADRALARVRSHRPGAHAAAWAQLLDALAQAKACLSDPAQKASYDNSLRTQQTAPQSDRPKQHSTSSDPEVASVNQLPDLFPPGMEPTTAAVTQPKPKTPSTAAASATATPVEAADAPNRAASKSQSKSPHKKPPPPPAPSSVVSRAGRLLDDPDEGTGTVISGISEPVPPAPINAHVAPPRRQQASMLPIIVGVVAVVVVITLLVVFLAMRGSLGGSMGGLSPQPAPAPAVKKSVTIAKRPAVAPSVQNPRAGSPPVASSSPGAQQQSVTTTSGDATVNKRTGIGSSSAPGVTVQQSPAPQVAAEPNVLPPNRPETGAAGGGAVSAASPPTPTSADLVQLSRTLTDVQFALGQHDFERAKLQLRNANTLATHPQHQALVARLQQLTDHSDRFWQTVGSVLRSFRGAEELQVGSGGLLVVVVEASPTSIIVRKEGRNWRYTLTEMPPGLALAIAKTRLKVDEPTDLLQLGACLATVADRKPAYLDEARKYWLQAQAAGADVDQLLLTLTDSYDLAQ